MAMAGRQITMDELRSELRHYATKADLAEVRTDLAQLESRLIKWMVGAMLGGMAAASTLTIGLQRLFGS